MEDEIALQPLGEIMMICSLLLQPMENAMVEQISTLLPVEAGISMEAQNGAGSDGSCILW